MDALNSRRDRAPQPGYPEINGCQQMNLRVVQQRFQIRELCYFVGLAEELYFARAAERVGIRQAPLSKAISLLEHRLRVGLFYRTGKRTWLTDVGAESFGLAPRLSPRHHEELTRKLGVGVFRHQEDNGRAP